MSERGEDKADSAPGDLVDEPTVARPPGGDGPTVVKPPPDEPTQVKASPEDVTIAREEATIVTPTPPAKAGPTRPSAGSERAPQIATPLTVDDPHVASPATVDESSHVASPATVDESSHVASPATVDESSHVASPATVDESSHVASPATVDEASHVASPATVDESSHVASPATLDQPAGVPETTADPAPKPRGRIRSLPRFVKILVPVLALLGVLFGLAYGLRHVLVLRVARERARALGIEVTRARATGFSLDQASLADVEFTLLDVPGVRGRADAVIASQSPRLTRVVASGVAVSIAGDPQASLEALGAWSRAHAAFFAVDLHASDAVIEVRGAAASGPWLTARRSSLKMSAAGLVFDSEGCSLLGVAAGPMKGTWSRDGSRATLDVGAPRGGVAPVKIDVRVGKNTSEVEAILAKTSFAELAPRMKAERATIAARAALTLRHGGAFDGVVNATADGWIPPHDKDLDGILYGAGTRFSSAVRVPAEGTKILLDDVVVEVGGVKLKGRGSADRAAGPRVVLDLKGALACSQVARSAASNYGPLGGLLADLAGGHVGGSVSVAIHIEGDVKDPKTFRPKPSIKQGCSVR